MKAQALKWPAPALEGSPAEACKARDASLFAADGQALVDFSNSCGAVLLGHADPDVEAAVAGATAGALSRLRAEVAEQLLSIMPLAHALFLYRSSGLARTGAMELVRRASGRSRVVACGGVQETDDAIAYGDLAALEAALAQGDVAAVLVAPVDLSPPCPSYLAGLRSLCDRFGAFLVFDETSSAFRVHEGGAQTLFNVRPDLTLIGESLANGRSIGVLAGDPILLATAAASAAPDVSSLAAAAATLAKLKRDPVTATLVIRGAEAQAELSALIRSHGAEDIVSMVGDPTMASVAFTGDAALIRSVWMRELRQRGIWCQGEHFISYAHTDRDIARLIDAYDQILPFLLRAATGEAVVRLQQRRLEREFAAG